MKHSLIVILLISFVITSCEKEEMLPDEDKEAFLILVNDIRQTGCYCGNEYMPPTNLIRWNDDLQDAAQNHSTDMAKHDYFDHISPNGSDPGDRISKSGYNWSSYGENIFMEQSSNGSASLAQNAFNGWLMSPGHCKNMMSPNYVDMGVGKKVREESNTTYWTQVFASPE